MANRILPRTLFDRLAANRSVAVIGLGRFGSALAGELTASGTDVLAIDGSEAVVEQFDGAFAQVVRADSTSEAALRQLAIPEFQHVVVAIGSGIEASVLTASLLLRLGVPDVWAKATTEAHGAILEQIGVRHVVFPERDMGRRVAHLVRGGVADFVELGSGQALVVAPATTATIGGGQPPADAGVQIVAVRAGEGDWRAFEAGAVVREGDTLLLLGQTAKAEAFGR